MSSAPQPPQSVATQDLAAVATDAAQSFRDAHTRIRDAVGQAIVGQTEAIDAALAALFTGGHVLLEGVPGLGKTMLVRSLGDAVSLDFSRIQFTPDLMPADVQGTQVLVDTEGGGHELRFQPGPLVANLVLADEINRATPKTQSALLEAMQEKQLSVGGKTLKLSEPYCVMATQNPVEQEGTYPLPEAQLDRFLMKIVVGYPKESEYAAIVDRTTGAAAPEITPVSDAEEILRLRQIVRSVPVPEAVKRHAIRLVMATQPDGEYAPDLVREHVSLGASPRGVQGLMLVGKVRALLAGRFSVAAEDVRGAAPDVLRHRVMLGFSATTARVRQDDVVAAVLEAVSPQS